MSDKSCPYDTFGNCLAPEDVDINDLNTTIENGCQGYDGCNHYQSLITSDIGCSSIYVGDEDDDPI